MRVGKTMFALLVGIGATLIQLVAVGALNDSPEAPVADATPAKASQPVVVTQSYTRPPTQRMAQVELQTSATQPTAEAVKRQTSVLPSLKGAPAGLGLMNVLPGLEGVGIGSVELPDAPTEPDRTAKERRVYPPVYPTSAQRDGVEGFVVVRLKIDVNGRVTNVLVVDSEPMGVFERSARDAARRFEFVPARVNGKSAPATVEKKIVFSLQ